MNVTFIVQLAKAAICEPQSLVCWKSLLFCPLIPTALRNTVLLLALVSAICRGGLIVPTFWLPNCNSPGDTAIGVAKPESKMNCGFEDALSVTVIIPWRVPAILGSKTTLMVHVAPAATVLPQLLLTWNSPTALNELMESATAPVLVRVTSWMHCSY
jgi:hypothetical protein